MAAAPMSDPSQQPAAPQGGTATQGAPPAGPGAPSDAPAPPELMFLAALQAKLKEFSQQVPAASAGLAKAIAGINEAMSAVTVANPQQQTPQQSPPY